MRIENADPEKVIYIGQRGENEATQVVFPKAYFAGFEGGAYELLAQRQGDANPYPVAITEDADNVYWTVNSTDCGVEGTGQCELRLTDGEYIVKSLLYVTLTGEALGTEGPLPEPYEDWADDLYATIDEKVGAAQQAVTDAHAEVLLAHAEYLDAKAQAEAAAGSASDAQRYAQTAHDEVQKFHVYVEGDSMFVTVNGEETVA